MTGTFGTTPSEQVRLNLIHYNLWTEVTLHNDHIVSGLPPQELVPTDDDVDDDDDVVDKNKRREWVVCKRLLNTKLSVEEINTWFEEIKDITQREGDLKTPINESLNSQSKEDKTDKEPIISNQTDLTTTKTTNTPNKWTRIKNINGKDRVGRITIAMINDDGTIVYYFIHDGITKPRQN
ncbi:hypothetical protein LELG_01838 [Lodderomyces elongisporus NRRL YB-4239]|uniref:tRNA-splicing endonuclease subunit Sen15 domain-containing protein n=1 Tax=Lodderomyces elongisporus (strain ATCC 11503 / CBS 2605 / JCM 1781 / NBRC 1676 / NRRL YB-4239) TaxID=379508 RepID=A5DWV1_LODEL|nr:hypothetical protein LELG_01838 [Lodderomyces elongisporus NRRL YB-4239]